MRPSLLHILPLATLAVGCSGKVAEQGPGPRTGATGLLDATGEVFQLVGGADTSGLQQSAWALDIPHRQWVRVDGPAEPRDAAAGARLEGLAWIFGGSTTGDVETARLSTWETRGGAWSDTSATGTVPPPRRAATLTPVSDTQAVLIGGRNDDTEGANTVFDDVWGFDADSPGFTEVQTTGGPGGLEGHAAAYDGERIWVHGGLDADGVPSAALWSLDTTSWAWTEHDTPDLAPGARADHLLAWWDGRLVVWGGAAEESQVWVYDPEAAVWGEVDGEAPSPRGGFAWDTVDGEPWAVLVGGDPFSTDGYESDVWVLSLESFVWTELANLDGSSF